MTVEDKSTKRRDYYIFDNKVVNEQKCKDDGYALLNKGDVETVGIHFHRYMNQPDAVMPCVEDCYDIQKGDLG